jgi:V8-like Glu-specific endopeptidase
MAVPLRASRRTRVILTVLLPALLLTAACRSAKPGETSLPAGPAAGTVVTHAFDLKSDTVYDRFRSGPAPAAGPLPTGTRVNGKLTAQKFNGTPTVGAIYFGLGSVASLHYCTASVVHSPSGDLIATAAHCVYNPIFGGYQSHILFVPAYSGGIAPFGTWLATTAYLDHRWIDSEDPDADVAFLKVQPAGGSGATLESKTGANRYQGDPGYTLDVSVAAYPMLGDQPVACAGRTAKFSDTQLRFDCAGFPEGASGAPFLSGDGKLVGILGGYQQGGNSADTSYATYFGDSVSAVFKAATQN